MSNNQESAQPELEARRRIDADIWLLMTVVAAVVLNLGAYLLLPRRNHVDVLAMSGFAWLFLGAGTFCLQVFARRLHWLLVLIVLAIAAVGFCVNWDMFAKISASC